MPASRAARRWIGTWLAVSALLITGVALAPEAQADTLTFRYVSSTGAYTDLDRPVYAQRTPAGSVAPGGSFRFTSVGSSFTLRVDDVAVLDGQTIPVLVFQQFTDGTYSWNERCVGNRSTVRHRSAGGATVYVAVFNELYWYGVYPRPPCTGAARAGTAYVGL